MLCKFLTKFANPVEGVVLATVFSTPPLEYAAYVKRSEGHLLKVIRPGLAEDATSSHSSEKNLEHISVDGKIFNTSTIEHLRNDIIEMEKRLK